MLKRILILLAFALACATPAQAATWSHWGSAKFASSPEEARSKLSLALESFDLPAKVKELFRAEIARNPEGSSDHLNGGDHVMEMMSGADQKHSKEWKMVDVTVDRNPVRKGVEEAAPTRVWEVEYEGKIYVLILPEVCNNWAWTSREAPAPKEKCATVTYDDIAVGMTYNVAVLAQGALSPSVCWARKEGAGEWEVWPDECSECIWDGAQAFILEHRKVSTKVRQSGKSTATATSVTLRVPESVARRDFLVVCVDDDGKPSREKYVEPKDFGQTLHYDALPFKW